MEELTCFANSQSCSPVQPGQYVIVRATADEGIYNDCTNVVLYKVGKDAKERVGVYCWETSGDCYLSCPSEVNIDTVQSHVPDKIVQTSDICTTTSRPDCRKAVDFFDRFQKAVVRNDRSAVASMIRYPLRVMLHGRKAVITTKSQLLQNYDLVFDSVVMCALTHAKRTGVWGNWQGFTVSDGVVWWERRKPDSSPFQIITVNNGAFYKGCGEPKS